MRGHRRRHLLGHRRHSMLLLPLLVAAKDFRLFQVTAATALVQYFCRYIIPLAGATLLSLIICGAYLSLFSFSCFCFIIQVSCGGDAAHLHVATASAAAAGNINFTFIWERI